MTTPNNPPAFPLFKQVAGHSYNEGMTLRDFFAAKAMQAQMIRLGKSPIHLELDAAFAYQVADAMLKARES